MSAADVPKLHLKWAFGFPGLSSAAVQPTIVGRSGVGREHLGTRVRPGPAGGLCLLDV